jgi:phosphoglycolate phosphatase-like HAD superfamily hydrolase
MPQKKNLIVFDIDGTLTDSVKIHQSAFITALQQLGVTEIDSNFKAYKHHTDSYIAKVIYEKSTNLSFDEKKIAEFERLLFENISHEPITEINGALKTIAYLEKETDFEVCYATGSLLKPAEYKLNQIGIQFSPKQLVASNSIFERENIVQTAIENAKEFYKIENFDTIISIGDGLWDLVTAKNLSLEFVGVGSLNREILIENGTKIHLNDLTAFDINEIEKKLGIVRELLNR